MIIYIRILLVLAVLPGFLLMRSVYKLDAIEREPIGMLVKLFILGALSIIYALILEGLGTSLILPLFPQDSVIFRLVEYFIVVALVEESGKYIMLKLGSWRNSNFNYQFDGVVYAVCVGMGFAIFENISYVFSSGVGISTALMRAVTAIPGHCVFAIFMGHYYGKAKAWASVGNAAKSKQFRIYSLLVPVLIHGFYDYSCSGSGIMTILFFVFIIVLYFFAFRRVKAYAQEDMPV